MSKKELLKPTIDVVFHALFREDNKELLGGLLSAILKEEVHVVTTDKNRYVEIEKRDEKLGVMDLRAELENGIQCNIEIQLKPHKYENERILYYWADTYRRQAKRGGKYEILNKTISVVILEHEIEELKGIEELGTKWQIRDDKTGKRVLTDRLEIVIIELPKAKRLYKNDEGNETSQWMMFLNNPNSEEVMEIMSKNKDIRKAIEELEQVSGDEKLQRIAELREKAIRDDHASMQYAIEKRRRIGKNQGKARGNKNRNCRRSSRSKE